MSCQPPLLPCQNLQFPSYFIDSETCPLSSSKERFLYLVRNLASTTGQFFLLSSFSQSSIQPMTSLMISTSWRTLISTLNFSSSRSNLQNCKNYEKSSQNKHKNKKVTYSISSSVHLSPRSLLHSCSLQNIVSSKGADVYNIAYFSREAPLKLDLFPFLIIFTLLQDLSPAPIPRHVDVTLPRMQV